MFGVKNMKQKILNLVYIIIGNIFIALAVNTLILENHIIVGGTSGIGNVLNHYFNIPVSLSVGCLNVCLFLVGLFFIGKKFAMTTLLSTFLFPIILQFFETHAMFHHYLEDPLLAAILAACLVGVGIGLILKANASTGGVDILAILLNKKFGFPVHIVLNCIDLSILVLQFTFNDTTHVIYGIMIVMITAVVLNKTLTQGTSLVQLTVISDHYEDIKQSILYEFDAGVTLLASEKGFTQENSKLLLSVLPYRKLPAIKAKIHELDPVAFVIVSHVEEVGGKGFTLEKRNA